MPNFTFGMKEYNEKDESIVVYPNPAKDCITIIPNIETEPGALEIEIFNLSGQKVLSKKIKRCDANSNYMLNISKLTGSVFVVRVYTRYRTFPAKFVKL